jgi:hypothetical protein
VGNQELARARLVPLSAVPSPDPARLVPVGLNFDDLDTPADVVDALILSAFADGSQPYSKTVRIGQIKPEVSLLPAGGQVLRVAADSGREARLATGDGWTVRAVVWRGGAAEVTVTAETQDMVDTMLKALLTDAEAVRAESDGRVTIGFWHRSERRGATRSVRKVAAQSWTEIRRNYAGATASALDQLMAVQPAALSGQLLLLYGPPGTGKTTALRALAREWLPWCDTDCVVDPETLFNDPSYLMEVTLGDDDDAEVDGRWRLLLLEDCDELIGSDAKRSSGQALSRLLNLTDGLLGQGRHVLVAITTNEDLRSLHPAAIRPGRCLAQVEVGPFPPAEAAAWLGRPDDGSGSLSLADLYARQNAKQPISSAQPAPEIGLYL